MTTEDMITAILKREGSTYTNFAADRGGPTRWGITLRTLSDYHHDNAVTADEVENLTEEEARAIYRELYVDRPGFSQISDSNLRAFLVDWGVNSGPKTAIKHLQRRLPGCNVDGMLGAFTARQANATDTKALYIALLDDRVAFYEAIVDSDPTQNVFLKGWLNRVDEFRSVSWP